jgi:hypothetical protein
MSGTVPGVIARYFEFESQRETESIVALFADDATGVHRGETDRGAEIHTWRLGPAFIYSCATEIGSVEPAGSGRYLLLGRLSGNLPVGTAEVNWDFTRAPDLITNLVIAP